MTIKFDENGFMLYFGTMNEDQFREYKKNVLDKAPSFKSDDIVAHLRHITPFEHEASCRLPFDDPVTWWTKYGSLYPDRAVSFFESIGKPVPAGILQPVK